MLQFIFLAKQYEKNVRPSFLTAKNNSKKYLLVN